jgi:sugar lactone lactonase YvrE
LNQLYFPAGLYVTDDQTIYIADWFNNRIVEWKIGETSGKVVAGGNGKGNRNDQLHFPTDVIVDKNRDCFFICDTGNKRIVQWPRGNAQNGTTIITGVMSYGLTIDDNGFLYISDHEKDEVRRWQVGDVQGKLVAGGNGRGDRFDQFHCPVSVFVDRDHSVYVSDYRNQRVVKWAEKATQGTLIADCRRLARTSSDYFFPRGIIVDEFGSIIVADATNNQIVCWQKDKIEGTIVIGSQLRDSKPDQLNHPIGLSVDLDGNLYVCEHQNHRVQMFTIDMRAPLHSS